MSNKESRETLTSYICALCKLQEKLLLILMVRPSLKEYLGPHLKENLGPSLKENLGSLKENSGSSWKENLGPSLKENSGNFFYMTTYVTALLVAFTDLRRFAVSAHNLTLASFLVISLITFSFLGVFQDGVQFLMLK